MCLYLLLEKVTQNLKPGIHSIVSMNKHFSCMEMCSQGDPATFGLPNSSALLKSEIDDVSLL